MLVHRADQLEPDVIAVTCHECRTRYSGDELQELASFDELICLDPQCRAGGMIPHRESTIEERFGSTLAADFTPIPNALMDEAPALGIGPHELLVIWGLERHRRARGDLVYPSRNRIARLTGLSPASVKRAIGALVSTGLIVRRPHFNDQGQTSSYFDLDPLWRKLSNTPGSDGPAPGSHRPGVHESSLDSDGVAQIDPGTPGHTDPPPRVTQTPEEEVFEVDAGLEEDPAGTSAASASLAAACENPVTDHDLETWQRFRAWRDDHPRVSSISEAWQRFTAEELEGAA